MTDLETVRKYTESPELALIVALNTWVSSVLTNEWFHADVHAGNLLMLKDGRVAFIDFGIVGSIPRSTADAMLDFVRAFPLGDMDGVARSLSGMGFTKELDARTTAAFAMDLQAVLDSIEAMPPAELANGVVDETQLNKAVAAVGSVATNYGIKFPREFVLLIKQVLYFDRYTRILAPGLNVLEDERLSMNRGPPPQIPVDVEVLPPE
jgi:predicted unusual protein kinase regulating ubiquinone biosynthesis (AarF/ABC1/UbiB family)